MEKKLSDDYVLKIRDAYIKGDPEYGYAGLAREFGVSPKAITQIIERKTYRHLTADMHAPVYKRTARMVGIVYTNGLPYEAANGETPTAYRQAVDDNGHPLWDVVKCELDDPEFVAQQPKEMTVAEANKLRAKVGLPLYK